MKANESFLQNLSKPTALNTLLALGPLGRRRGLDNQNTEKRPSVRRVNRDTSEENTTQHGTHIYCTGKLFLRKITVICTQWLILLSPPFLSFIQQVSVKGLLSTRHWESKEDKTNDPVLCTLGAYERTGETGNKWVWIIRKKHRVLWCRITEGTLFGRMI